MCVEQDFFVKVVEFAKEHKLMVVHDFAYADFAFDGYRPPSFLAVPGAKEVGVEIFSLSKSYNMPGWRMGFVCGNSRMIHALGRIKSYLDYGAFQPIQIAPSSPWRASSPWCATSWSSTRSVATSSWTAQQDRLVRAQAQGHHVRVGTHSRRIPRHGIARVLQDADPGVQGRGLPGIGFGEYGEGYVRFALVENEQRIRQALRGLKTLGAR